MHLQLFYVTVSLVGALQLSWAGKGRGFLSRVQEGDDVTLTCPVPVSPDVTWYTWKKDGHTLLNRTADRTFLMVNVNRESSGLYSCERIDTGDAAVLELLVQYPPEVTKSTTSLQVNDGDIAHLVCNVHGVPRPTIQWKSSKKTVDNNCHGVALLEPVNTSTSALTSHLFVAVVGSQGQGQYHCVATNELGTSRKTFVIQGKKKQTLSLVDRVGLALGLSLSSLLLLTLAYYIRKRTKFLKHQNGNTTPQQNSSTCSDDDEDGPWIRRALLPGHTHKTQETGV